MRRRQAKRYAGERVAALGIGVASRRLVPKPLRRRVEAASVEICGGAGGGEGMERVEAKGWSDSGTTKSPTRPFARGIAEGASLDEELWAGACLAGEGGATGGERPNEGFKQL